MFASQAPKTQQPLSAMLADDELAQPLVNVPTGSGGFYDNASTTSMGKPRSISTGFTTDIYQIRALFLKNFMLQLRQYKSNCCQILLPIVCLLFMFGMQLFVNILTRTFPQVPTRINGTQVTFDQFYAGVTKRPIYEFYLPDTFAMVVDRDQDKAFLGDMLNNSFTGTGLLKGICGKFGDMNNCSPFPTSPVLRRNYTYVDLYTREKTSEWSIVPFTRPFNSSYAVNLEIAERMQKTLGRFENITILGSYQFHQFNLNTEPNVQYTVQFDNITETLFCRIAARMGGVSCKQIMPTGMINMINSMLSYFITQDTIIATSVEQMPYETQAFSFSVADSIGIFLYPFIFLLPLPTFVHFFIVEKVDKLKEFMKLMGCRSRNYYGVTFVFQYLMYTFSTLEFIIISAIMGFGFTLGSSFLILIIGFIGWGLLLISFSFFLSSILKDKLTSVILGYVMVLFLPIASVILEMSFFSNYSGKWSIAPLLLIFPLPMTRWAYLLATACSAKTCLSIQALSSNVDLQASLIFMYVSSIVYLVLGYYLDNVVQQNWGISKSYFFPIQNAIKFLKWLVHCISGRLSAGKARIHYASYFANSNKENHGITDEDVLDERKKIMNEQVSPDEVGLMLVNIKKSYGKKQAVKGVNLSVQKQECFGLLGQNGAGKTTTISMLCGLFGPTAGTAFVNGYDITYEMDAIRMSMGLCPQFDILFDDLTCREHLLFYARIKGMPIAQEKQHVEELLTMVGLSANDLKGRSPLVKSLSGGMKRRLSIAIALVGNPGVVLLDEPTTGLDPTSKRHLWDVILEAKKNRCIVLTTHSMEEADALCDRIGIMHEGQMRCLGTSLRLKAKFGGGYRISVNYLPQNREEAKAFITNKFADARVVNEFTNITTFEISAKSVQVSQLFSDMEKSKLQSNTPWQSWSLSHSTLEDVFLTLVTM